MFADYAKFFGMQEEHFRKGLESYLLYNAKSKENLKSMFCMPYTFELPRATTSSDTVVAVVKIIDSHYINSLKANFKDKGVPSKVQGEIIEEWKKEFTLSNLIENRSSSGMKLSKWFLRLVNEYCSQIPKYSKSSTFADILYSYLEINSSTEITNDIVIQRLLWYISNQCAAIKVKISTEIEDIMECSTSCSWSSCYAPSGSYRTAPFAFALDDCTAIALFYKGTSKIGRTWIHIDAVAGRFVIGRNYGNVPSGQVNAVADRLKSLLGFENATPESGSLWTSRKHNMSYVDAPSLVYRDARFTEKDLAKGVFSSGVPAILCIHCGEPINKQGELICEECRKNKMKKCSQCGNAHFGDEIPLYSGSRLGIIAYGCPRCITKYEACKDCGKPTHGAKSGYCLECYRKIYASCTLCGHEYSKSKYDTCPRCAITVLCDGCKIQTSIFNTVPYGEKAFLCGTCFAATLC